LRLDDPRCPAFWPWLSPREIHVPLTGTALAQQDTTAESLHPDPEGAKVAPYWLQGAGPGIWWTMAAGQAMLPPKY
jgi:hypothetical protein